MASKRDLRLFCSFCKKTKDEVNKLIAGPDVYICDECVRLCGQIVAEIPLKDYPEYAPGRRAQESLARSVEVSERVLAHLSL